MCSLTWALVVALLPKPPILAAARGTCFRIPWADPEKSAVLALTRRERGTHIRTPSAASAARARPSAPRTREGLLAARGDPPGGYLPQPLERAAGEQILLQRRLRRAAAAAAARAAAGVTPRRPSREEVMPWTRLRCLPRGRGTLLGLRLRRRRCRCRPRSRMDLGRWGCRLFIPRWERRRLER